MFVSQIFDEASETLGTSDSSRVFRKLTQAVAALMESGHWFHTNQEVDVCTGWDKCLVTLPRGVDTPLAINVDGSPVYFRGRLFQYHINGGGQFNGTQWTWDDRGFVATQMEITQPSELIALADSDNDVGKTLRVLGVDSGNRDLRSALPDGTGVDGLLIPIHSKSDFQFGTISADGARINTRSATITAINEFFSNAAHQLSSGQAVVLASCSGTTPKGLNVGQQYYVGVTGNNTIQLYNDPLYAQAGTYPIALNSIDPANPATLSLLDQRAVQLQTSVLLSSAPAINITAGNEVVFGITGVGALPSPLVAGVTYFANVLDPLNLQIFTSLQDAQNNTNPVLLTGTSTNMFVNIRKPMAPQTEFSFTVPHYFSTGDEVQAYTNGGVLPTPLVAAQNYFVNAVNSQTVTLHSTYSDAVAGINPIIITSAGSGVSSLVKLLPASINVGNVSQVTAPGFGLQPATGSGANITAQVIGSITSISTTNPGSGYNTLPTVQISAPLRVISHSCPWQQPNRTATAHCVSAGGGTLNVVLDDGGYGYSPTDTITITFVGGDGSNAAASAVLTTSFLDTLTIVSGGSNYNYPPQLAFSGGGGTGAVATAVVSGGVVVSYIIEVIGTGYVSAPGVTVTPNSGIFIQFSTTGTYPAPLAQGVTYLVGQPYTTDTFTVTDTSFNPINITSLGSGNFYVAISRAFSITWTNIWAGDFSGITTGEGVYFGTDYLLPVTSPPSDSVTEVYARVLSKNTAQFYQTQAEAEAGGSTGLFTITEFGVGQSYYAVQVAANGAPYGNVLIPGNPQYLQDGMNVTFSTPGTLPAPLALNTNYTIKIVGSQLQVWAGSDQVEFVALGVSALYMDILRTFQVKAPTTLQAPASLFATGDTVTVRPSTNDALPLGETPNSVLLTAGVTYYVLRVSNDTFSLYSTLEGLHAQDPTTLFSYFSPGDSLTSSFFVDQEAPPVLVRSVSFVDKPETDGYISLYAYDYGRSNDMTLIGQYHPSERNPQYRRIRIGQPSAWVRMIYKMRAPKITSIYDYIPIEQERAILDALKAVDLTDKDFFDQAEKYWQSAFRFLTRQQTSIDGHALQAIQVDNLTYGDRTDPVIF